MSLKFALALAVAGIGAAAYAWTLGSNHKRAAIDLASSQPASPAVATTQSTGTPRVTSPKEPVAQASRATTQPNASPAGGSWGTVAVAEADETFAPRAVTTSPSTLRLSSSKPGDAAARAELVRDIQRELKRVGCYGGEVHGWWSSSTRNAMKAFTERVNAALPVEEADYILLSLVQSHKGIACGGDCPKGQVAGAGGRCLPRAIVAQQKGGHKAGASSADARFRARAALEPLPEARHELLQGRMAVGAPIAGASERAEIALEEARRRQSHAALGSTDEQQSSAGLSIPAAAATGEQSGATASAHAAHAPEHRRAERRAAPSRSSYAARKGSTRQMLATSLRNAP